MKKSDWTTGSIVLETLTAVFMLTYTGLRVFYGIYYGVSISRITISLVAAYLAYAGLTLLAFTPEKINGLSPAACSGKIRVYSLRMVRLAKLIFVGSLLIPGTADALGKEMRSAYSAVPILMICAVSIYYECRILNEIKDGKSK